MSETSDNAILEVEIVDMDAGFIFRGEVELFSDDITLRDAKKLQDSLAAGVPGFIAEQLATSSYGWSIEREAVRAYIDEVVEELLSEVDSVQEMSVADRAAAAWEAAVAAERENLGL